MDNDSKVIADPRKAHDLAEHSSSIALLAQQTSAFLASSKPTVPSYNERLLERKTGDIAEDRDCLNQAIYDCNRPWPVHSSATRVDDETNKITSLDKIKRKLSKEDFTEFADQLLHNKSFQEYEPQLALNLVAQNFDLIHDNQRGSTMTVADLKKFKQDCLGDDPIKQALVDWILHQSTDAPGQTTYDRFQHLTQLAGETDGLTKDGLTQASTLVDAELSYPKINGNEQIWSDLKFLQSNAQSLATKSHPGGVTTYALDRMAYSNDPRATNAESIKLRFNETGKYLGASGPELTWQQIAAGVSNMSQIMDEDKAKTTSYANARRLWLDNPVFP